MTDKSHIRIWWINDYECWAGLTIEECHAASRKFWNSPDLELDAEDACEVPREVWSDRFVCTDDNEEPVYKPTGPGHRGPREVDYGKTPHESFQQIVDKAVEFPAPVCFQE